MNAFVIDSDLHMLSDDTFHLLHLITTILNTLSSRHFFTHSLPYSVMFCYNIQSLQYTYPIMLVTSQPHPRNI